MTEQQRKELGELMRLKRLEKQLFQRELGEMLGYTGERAQVMVSAWERGTRVITRKAILKLSQILEIPIELFLD